MQQRVRPGPRPGQRPGGDEQGEPFSALATRSFAGTCRTRSSACITRPWNDDLHHHDLKPQLEAASSPRRAIDENSASRTSRRCYRRQDHAPSAQEHMLTAVVMRPPAHADKVIAGPARQPDLRAAAAWPTKARAGCSTSGTCVGVVDDGHILRVVVAEDEGDPAPALMSPTAAPAPPALRPPSRKSSPTLRSPSDTPASNCWVSWSSTWVLCYVFPARTPSSCPLPTSPSGSGSTAIKDWVDTNAANNWFFHGVLGTIADVTQLLDTFFRLT